MTVFAFICLTIFLVLFFTLFNKGTDVFAPARLFTLVWSFAIGLVGLKFSGLQKIWPIYSWLSINNYSFFRIVRDVRGLCSLFWRRK